MSKDRILMVGLVLLILTLVVTAVAAPPVSVNNLTSSVGPTYINWSWNSTGLDNSTWIVIHIDGKYEMGTRLEHYILSGLEPREIHSISLINNTNESIIYASASTRTFYPPILFYLILIFSIGFLLLEIFLKNATLTIIIGTLCFVMSILGFYMSYPYYFSILSYLMIGIAVIALLWVLMASFSLLSKGKNVEEDII